MQAVIDLGTNMFHLIIGEFVNSQPNIVYKTNSPVKLGENITLSNTIIPAAFERGINCLVDFRKKIDEFDVKKITAVATSAVRSATNGKKFTEAALEKAGIQITTINGDEEAQYIYQGVKASGAITGKCLIMDIGGGSTEFILSDEADVFWKKSFDIGASRLMQKFFKSDPLSADDHDRIYAHLAQELPELLDNIKTYNPRTLIGSAGAFESFAEMISPTVDLNQSSSSDIDISAYNRLAQELLSSNHHQRQQMRGLIPLRVDMIVMATIQTSFLLNNHAFTSLKLSTFDLKMGVLADG